MFPKCKERKAEVGAVYLVPSLSMIEQPYKKIVKKARALPFRTGLLARMQRAGGVKAHAMEKIYWADEFLQQIFGADV